MKKVIKVVFKILFIIALVLTGGMIYFNSTYPKAVPVENIKIQVTPERLVRGEYLTKHVAMCLDCHSERDWSKYAGPVVPGTEGKGGELFDEEIGVPGKVYVKNITPAALDSWSDGELIRAITCGINKNDEALFPIMPYANFNNLTRDDLYSIITYIRTLKPVKAIYPEKELNFPVNFISKTLPLQTYTPKDDVDKSDPVNYGKYLVTIANCGDCHSPSNDKGPIAGKEFSGGVPFNLPFGIVRPANITPDVATGIGAWSKETFIKRFKAFDPKDHQYVDVPMGNFNSIMPWTMYAGMSEEDLGAIYDYLRTVKPVNNSVEKFTPKQR